MLRCLSLLAIMLLASTISYAQNPPVLTASVLLVHPYDSVSYTHSNGRETIIRSEPHYQTSVDIGFDFSKKWAFSHYLGKKRVYKLASAKKCTYNSSNSLTSAHEDYYDIATSLSTGYQYWDYTYNANQTIDTIFYQGFSPLISPIILKGGEKYIYNNASLLIRKHSFHWDSAQSVWIDQGATDSFFYNGNGQLVKEVSIDWLVKYSYDNNGLKIADTAFWGGKTYDMLWVYDYYAGGNLKSKERLLYDPNQQIWLPDIKMTLNYNGNNCTDITYWEWDKTSNSYQQTHKTTYQYNSYNQIVQAGDTRYYYEGFPAAIDETATTQQALSIYPVPAVTFTNIEISFDKLTEFAIIIFDMQGRMVKQFTDKANGTYKKTINIQDIPAGQYMLQVKTAEETTVKNFTVIR